MSKNNQNGAIVVEAAFVLPITIIVVYILLYMAFMYIEQAVMYSEAQKMSHVICNIINYPGYEYLLDNSKPTKNTLEEVYSQHEPYRYWSSYNKLDTSSFEAKLGNVINYTAILRGRLMEPQISIKKVNFSIVVEVNLIYNIELPAFVKIIGLSTNKEITATAVTYANDSIEFIRNVDVVYDLTNYLLEKLYIKENIKLYYEKLVKAIRKLF